MLCISWRFVANESSFDSSKELLFENRYIQQRIVVPCFSTSYPRRSSKAETCKIPRRSLARFVLSLVRRPIFLSLGLHAIENRAYLPTYIFAPVKFRRTDRNDNGISINRLARRGGGGRGWPWRMVFARQKENASTVLVGGMSDRVNRPVKPQDNGPRC